MHSGLRAIGIVIGVEDEHWIQRAKPVRLIGIGGIVGQAQLPFPLQGMTNHENEEEQNSK